uniref:hypothetical protein n=1 Tax=Ndongobacter massiliensis TaxID=1871025 RepID=UPI000931B2D1|nr:hypothetical protein [Ndongobacter massiliensis]
MKRSDCGAILIFAQISYDSIQSWDVFADNEPSAFHRWHKIKKRNLRHRKENVEKGGKFAHSGKFSAIMVHEISAPLCEGRNPEGGE